MTMPRLPMRWKFALVFGLLGLITVAGTSYVTPSRSFEMFNKELGEKLTSIAKTVAQAIDAESLVPIHSVDHPAYPAVKKLLVDMQTTFNLPWIALYRVDGDRFRHIADGAEMGDEFIPDYPILDVSDDMLAAARGKPSFAAAEGDAFGSWQSAYHPITLKDGTVFGIVDVSKDNQELDLFRHRINQDTLQLTLVIVLLVVFVSTAFGIYLSRPITALSEVAGEIAGGNLNARVSLDHSEDEMGDLIRTFNLMADDLVAGKAHVGRKIFELTTLFEISRKINFANNTQEILGLILEKCVHGLKVERGSIMLYSEEEETLAVEVVFLGTITTPSPRIQLSPSQGIAGKAFTSMKPVVVNDRVDRAFVRVAESSSDNIDTIMCLPLMVENKAIGVINLVNKGGGPFDEADVAFAHTMASQIALTIEKARLYELSVTDGLTKLFVHRYFQAALETEIQRSRRYGHPVSMILFDIDHFKNFNDTYGHQVGDLVLANVAMLLKDSLRTVDIAARYGGEEFAVILPETPNESAMPVAERLRERVGAFAFPGWSEPLQVTISVGVGAFPMHASQRLALIRQADEALYACKHKGRNCVTMARPDPDMETPAPAEPVSSARAEGREPDTDAANEST